MEKTPDHLIELAEILALGLLRLRRRQTEQSNCSVSEKVGLDFPPDQSVHTTVSTGNGAWRHGGRLTPK